jgi:hypothetical protein
VWVKAERLRPLAPRTAARFKNIYDQRGAVEREFGYLTHESAMRVRSFDFHRSEDPIAQRE